jgi:hypothetical protein
MFGSYYTRPMDKIMLPLSIWNIINAETLLDLGLLSSTAEVEGFRNISFWTKGILLQHARLGALIG